ncbi:MAG: DNA-3-methyladenine glycosylase I [Lachnospiraceae bacterium]|nr:DNA-3-methyladenine glycosylase I [Lachnospiraceae bacterium]
MNRCGWCCDGGIVQKYHDEEWGIPLHDDRKHFEYLSMEVMQCGLNWTMMLKKRDIFRKCFADFDYNQIAKFEEPDIIRIMNVEGMIKSRRKIEAIIGNAKAYIWIIEEYGSFDRFLWSYTNHESLIYLKHQNGQGEASNALSDQISRDLKKRGFKYLGSITVFSHLQACGIINDHSPQCYMYEKLIHMGNVRYISD